MMPESPRPLVATSTPHGSHCRLRLLHRAPQAQGPRGSLRRKGRAGLSRVLPQHLCSSQGRVRTSCLAALVHSCP